MAGLFVGAADTLNEGSFVTAAATAAKREAGNKSDSEWTAKAEWRSACCKKRVHTRALTLAVDVESGLCVAVVTDAGDRDGNSLREDAGAKPGVSPLIGDKGLRLCNIAPSKEPLTKTRVIQKVGKKK